MKKTALIMAGGRGERFWPKSRRNMPKQFLSLTGDGKTMIQLTVERISPLVDLQDIYIATNRNYKSLVREQLLVGTHGQYTPAIGAALLFIEEFLQSEF